MNIVAAVGRAVLALLADIGRVADFTGRSVLPVLLGKAATNTPALPGHPDRTQGL